MQRFPLHVETGETVWQMTGADALTCSQWLRYRDDRGHLLASGVSVAVTHGESYKQRPSVPCS